MLLAAASLAAACMLPAARAREPFEHPATIPKRIWTYWDDGEIPDCVTRCINGWTRLHPEYTLHFVRPKNLSALTDDLPRTFSDLGPARQSDWVRLYVLHTYGGIWIDASIVLTKPLEWVLHKQAFAYCLEKFSSPTTTVPVIESWFLACVPGHPFFKAWFVEFDWVCRTYGGNGTRYIGHLKKTYGPKKYAQLRQKIDVDLRAYLTIHLTAQKIMQCDGVPPIDCHVAEDGPYALLVLDDWVESAFAKRLVTKPHVGRVPEMIKLGSTEREALEDMLTTTSPHPDSIYALYLEK